VIVADTGAIVALVDADDRHHAVLRRLFEKAPDAWVLPWAILPEVDYLLGAHVGGRAEERFVGDVASGAWAIEWGDPADLVRAEEIARRHRGLRLGLVDAVVMAVAERRRADAIATLDLRHFGAVTLRGRPGLLPRDLGVKA
jgi:predicted nucleic acid-binding protein